MCDISVLQAVAALNAESVDVEEYEVVAWLDGDFEPFEMHRIAIRQFLIKATALLLRDAETLESATGQGDAEYLTLLLMGSLGTLSQILAGTGPCTRIRDASRSIPPVGIDIKVVLGEVLRYCTLLDSVIPVDWMTDVLPVEKISSWNLQAIFDDVTGDSSIMHRAQKLCLQLGYTPQEIARIDV